MNKLISGKGTEEKTKYKMSELVPLWLDGYDDIFSDFDSRPYSQRALSVDFLDEAKRATRDKRGKLELKLLLDEKLRNKKSEILIKKRLKNHFNHHFQMLKKEKQGFLNKGINFVIMGMALMLITTFILFNYGEISIFSTFIIVLLEPAGWFLFWEGLNLVLFESKKVTEDLKFYEKMLFCSVQFFSNRAEFAK